MMLNGMTRRMILAVLLAGSLTAAGCYDVNEVKAFLQRPRSPVSGLEYRVLPPDMISITSTRVPEINNFQSAIRPDGKINLPLLGEIYVADKTPSEIEAALTEAAKEYYKEVDVAVQVTGYNSRKFYVFGQVSRPGPVRWTGCDTLLDVLAQAQPTPLAWPERIVVIRSARPNQGGYLSQPSLKHRVLGVNEFGQDPNALGPDAKGSSAGSGPGAAAETPATRPADASDDGNSAPAAAGDAVAYADAVPHKMTVNLLAMVQHGDMANNILLKPNDIIYVQPNPFARASLAMERVFMPVRAAADGLSDLRELQYHWKWIEDHFPAGAEGRQTIYTRGSGGGFTPSN